MATARELFKVLDDKMSNVVDLVPSGEIELLMALADAAEAFMDLQKKCLCGAAGQCKLMVDDADGDDLTTNEVMCLLEIELCGLMLGVTKYEDGEFNRPNPESIWDIMAVGRSGFYQKGTEILDEFDDFDEYLAVKNIRNHPLTRDLYDRMEDQKAEATAAAKEDFYDNRNMYTLG